MRQPQRLRPATNLFRTAAPHLTALAALAVLLAPGFVARADDKADWPNFRGPNYDGISREKGLRTRHDKPLKLVWEREIGDGFSSFAAVADRIYTCGTADKQQVAYCLSADDGSVVWQTPIEPEYMERQGGDGPRATPTVDDGRVYIMGAKGTLLCLGADDGKEIWKKQYRDPPQWGFSGSVLIDGELAILCAGGKQGSLLALDRKTGEKRWSCGDDPVGYATPYPFTLGGHRYVVGFGGKSAIIADAKSGELACRIPWEMNNNVNAASPIFDNGYLFLGSGYGHGCATYKLTRKGDRLAADEAWGGKMIMAQFQSPVLLDGFLYVSDERGLKCVNFKTGKEGWQRRNLSSGTIVAAQDHLFFLTQDGKLMIAPASPKEFKPTTEAEILSDRCWAVPVIYKGRIYARNLSRVVCFDLK